MGASKSKKREWGWEDALRNYGVPQDKIEDLRQKVNDKIENAKIWNLGLFITVIGLVTLFLVLIGVYDWFNLISTDSDNRSNLINALIAFGLAGYTAFTPSPAGITAEEVKNIIGIDITTAIMERINKTIEQESSLPLTCIDKWIAFISAVGVIIATLMGLLRLFT